MITVASKFTGRKYWVLKSFFLFKHRSLVETNAGILNQIKQVGVRHKFSLVGIITYWSKLLNWDFMSCDIFEMGLYMHWQNPRHCTKQEGE